MTSAEGSGDMVINIGVGIPVALLTCNQVTSRGG